MLNLDPYARIADFYELKVGALSPSQAGYGLTQLERHRIAVYDEQRLSWRAFREHIQRTVIGVGPLATRYLQVSKLVQRLDSLILVYRDFSESNRYSESSNGRSD